MIRNEDLLKDLKGIAKCISLGPIVCKTLDDAATAFESLINIQYDLHNSYSFNKKLENRILELEIEVDRLRGFEEEVEELRKDYYNMMHGIIEDE